MNKFAYLLIAVLLLTAGCSKQEPHSEADGHGHEAEASKGQSEESHVEGEVKLDGEQEKLAGIEVETVQLRTVQASLDVPGVINSTTKGRAVVTPPVAGRVVSITVALGDKVRQGQTLAIIESAELAQSWASIADAERNRDAASATLRETKSEVDLALSKLAAAKSNLTRQRELAKAGAFSQAPLQQAQSELNDAQSELLSVQKEQASHAEVVRRLENLYRDGIVSKSELEAARLELQQDQIRLDRASARIANAKATYDREKNIASRGLLNAKELQTAEAEVRSAQLEVDRSRIRVRSAEAAVANANREIANARSVYRSSSAGGSASVGRVALTAPIAGTLTHLDVTKGQAVDRTQVLMEVENLSSVWVTANVPEQDAVKVRTGASVRVTVAALQGREFGGVVQVVGNRVDPKTRAIPVQCLVTGVSGELKPDMFATVHLNYGAGEQAIAVPRTSIVTEEGKSFVFVKHDDGYMKTAVELGTRSDGHIEVVSGLKVGDIVVVKGGFVLASEQKKDELKGHEH
ncbi:MAG: efflux RND transporter periplasmic adaptor subunit [Fimbriimonadaceae bacterium]|jgi:cobalt-zinc-cadmium efflux system membrane fusion protein|nr:efflux RND transporter periplasmic adaptor subunit [Fimbriimonadaceae bacterium]